jgi:hypothetical protein
VIVYRPGFAKRAVLFLSDVVSRLVNHCISTNVFQSYLKLARVVLVLNSKIQLVLNNYRPNSILNISSKIFEQILHIRLQKYLDAHSMIIDQWQSIWYRSFVERITGDYEFDVFCEKYARKMRYGSFCSWPFYLFEKSV